MLINGTAGNDAIVGTAEFDHIRAGAGDDLIDGGAGNDKMAGEAGDDTFLGGAGADYLHGGVGIDTVDYRTSAAAVAVNLAIGTGSGGDAAGDTLVDIENLMGSQYNDILLGSARDNRLTGGAGHDRMAGGDGFDVLAGGAGNDVLTGGQHSDTFQFVWSTYGQATGIDVVTDFQVGVDVLHFQNAFWGTFNSVDDLGFMQVGADTVIMLSVAESVTLRNVDMQQLLANAAHDFLFT
jgi:large repetitive protein